MDNDLHREIGLLRSVLEDRFERLSPYGLIAVWPGETEPKGWVFCDGRALSRKGYPQLFAAIGTTFGAGDRSETFNVPDLSPIMPTLRYVIRTGKAQSFL
jgi:microcystin-dependent protein